MKRLMTLLSCMASLGIPITAHALGTAAGTDIDNTASLDYTVGASNVSTPSNTVTITVDELLDVDVQSQDGANVVAQAGSTGNILTFLVTNTGNGSEDFELLVSDTEANDDFDLDSFVVYIDQNANGTFDAGVDDVPAAVFVPGAGNDTVTIAADASITVFISGDLVGGEGDGDLNDIALTAQTELITDDANITGATGDSSAGAGDSGTDAIGGLTGGTASDIGTYEVADVVVTFVKSSAVDASAVLGMASTDPIPGATITYTITVTITGSATATSVLITDPIPANTSYVASSMTVDFDDAGGGLGGVQALGDGAADDGANPYGVEGEHDGGAGANGEVYFDLPDVTAGAATTDTYILTFQVTID